MQCSLLLVEILFPQVELLALGELPKIITLVFSLISQSDADQRVTSAAEKVMEPNNKFVSLKVEL